MDIGSLDLHEAETKGAEFELRHPGNGSKTGVFLTVQGYDCDAVTKAGRDVRRRAAKAKDRDDAAEILATQRAEFAKAALLSIRGATGDNTTVDHYRALIDKGAAFIWIVEQIEAFAGDRASFFPKPETD